MEIAIVVFDGFDELDAIGPYEVFQNAARGGAECATTLRTIEQRERVRASHGLRIEPDGRLADADPDIVEREFGSAVADTVSREMEYHRRDRAHGA